MDTNKYKVIPFSEISIGQVFEEDEHESSISNNPWIKSGDNSAALKSTGNDSAFRNKDKCLVRIADCKTQPKMVKLDDVIDFINQVRDGEESMSNDWQDQTSKACCRYSMSTLKELAKELTNKLNPNES